MTITRTTCITNLLDKLIETELITFSDGSGNTDRSRLYATALNGLIEQARAEGLEVSIDDEPLSDALEVWVDDRPNTIGYVLPMSWACYIINGDASGLGDGEQDEIDRFLEGEGNPNFVSVSEDHWFSHTNDANDMGGDVANYTALLGTE